MSGVWYFGEVEPVGLELFWCLIGEDPYHGAQW